MFPDMKHSSITGW